MKIKTNELKQAVKDCVIGTSSKDLIAQMAHVVFNEEEMFSYNDRVSVFVPFESGITCSVPAEDLNKVLSGISDDELEMTVDGNEVTLKSKNTKAVISTEIESRVVEDFFNSIAFSDMNWGSLPSNFLDQLALARFSASSNALDANNLFCVSIKGDTISSGDGHRLSVLTLDQEMKSILIPATSISDILAFPDFDEYAVKDGWVHFSNESNCVLSCRTVLGDFPSFSKIFEAFTEKTSVTIESNLIPVLQNLGSLVAGQADFMRAVTIKIINGETTISGKKEGLRIEKKISNKHDGETVEFSISPDFLTHILTMTNTLSIDDTTAMFSSETFKHLVQLPIIG